ncbi:MAG: peptidylprolyl isomerase [Pirellulales bacterium]|nr:peptidylprolyl isomerase [Pirellulales bacterium]
MTRMHAELPLSRLLLAWCLAGCLPAALAAQDAQAPAGEASERVVVARFGDQSIYQDEVERELQQTLRGGQAAIDALPMLQAEALEALVKRRIIMEYLRREGLTPTAADVENAIQLLQTNLQRENKTYEDFLKLSNRTDAQLREETVYRTGLQALVRARATDAVLEQYFNEHRQLFDGSVLRLSHIIWRVEGVDRVRALNETLAKAEQVRTLIGEGKLTFEDAAARFSAGPSRRKGGDLGFIPRRGRLENRFTDAAFRLKKDEVSPPVRTGVGVHLIKCTDIRPGQKSWVEVRDELVDAYSDELLNSVLAEEIKQANLQFTGAMPYFVFGTQQLVVPPRPAK